MTDAHTKFFGPPPPGYVFTEIVNVTFPAEPDLENEASPEGQIWTSTLQTYLTHPGTKTVWWGRRVDSPQVVKLIIDWKTAEERSNFLSSSAFSSLLRSWQSSPKPFASSTPSLFTLPRWDGDRQNVFMPPERRSYQDDTICISVLITFNFSSAWDPEAIDPDDSVEPKRAKKRVWQNAWDVFYNIALKSEGGIISSKGAAGWSVPAIGSDTGRSFLGVFRFMDLNKAKAFFDSSAYDGRMGGLGKLKALADAGTEAEFVRMVFEKTK